MWSKQGASGVYGRLVFRTWCFRYEKNLALPSRAHAITIVRYYISGHVFCLRVFPPTVLASVDALLAPARDAICDSHDLHLAVRGYEVRVLSRIPRVLAHVSEPKAP